ncbi:MAG: LPS export ABC transporter periplasmic protein LptC [Motiliproteus sp.]|nr:LPS export ABC transporter periplasmic protein LptC [Motiliproteus sp.]MCW9051003.1 LPS export ABC transporter periplasmic protein LptC [Motiliproteus sp.]
MSKRKLKLALTMTLSALILGYWGFYEPVAPVAFKNPLDAAKEIDGFMVNSVTSEFDQQGQLKQRLTSTRTNHYPATDITTLETPELMIYRTDKSPVRVVAELGEVGPDQQEVELHRDVRVTEQVTDGFRMETEYLRIEPDNDYAETDTAVTLHNRTGQMHSIGMQAFFAEDRLKLLNNVRGIHEPQ